MLSVIHARALLQQHVDESGRVSRERVLGDSSRAGRDSYLRTVLHILRMIVDTAQRAVRGFGTDDVDLSSYRRSLLVAQRGGIRRGIYISRRANQGGPIPPGQTPPSLS